MFASLFLTILIALLIVKLTSPIVEIPKLNAPNILNAIEENIKCLSQGNKVDKRRKRSLLIRRLIEQYSCDNVTQLIKYIDDGLAEHADVEDHIMRTVTPDEIQQHLDSGSCPTPGITITIDKGAILDDAVKKVLSSAVTEAINRDFRLYNHTCTRVIIPLQNMIKMQFPTEYACGDIIVELKGGMAQRLMLQELFPEASEEIAQNFSIGDNDVGVKINPNLPEAQFNYIFTEVNRLVVYTLMCAQHEIEILLRDYEHINISPHGKAIPLQLYESCGFDGYINNGDKSVLIYGTQLSTVPRFSNELNYELPGANPHFTLHRLKAMYKSIDGTVIPGEVVDIAIPHRDDTGLITAYEKHHSSEDYYHQLSKFA